MILRRTRWIVPVFCICVIAVLTTLSTTGTARVSPLVNPSSSAFFRAINTINAGQASAVRPISLAPPATTVASPAIPPLRSIGGGVPPGHAPAAFHNAVRLIESQQRGPVRLTAEIYRPVPATSPRGRFRSVAALAHVNNERIWVPTSFSAAHWGISSDEWSSISARSVANVQSASSQWPTST